MRARGSKGMRGSRRVSVGRMGRGMQRAGRTPELAGDPKTPSQTCVKFSLLTTFARPTGTTISFFYSPLPKLGSPTLCFFPPCISHPPRSSALASFALTTFFHSSVRSLPPQLSSVSLRLVSCHCHVRGFPSETTPTRKRALKFPAHPGSSAGSRRLWQPLMVARSKTSAHGTSIHVCPSKPGTKVGRRKGKE